LVSYRLYLVFFSFLYTLLKETFKMIFYPSSPLRVATMRGRLYGFMHYKPAGRPGHA
jgi:hypothetical protein